MLFDDLLKNVIRLSTGDERAVNQKAGRSSHTHRLDRKRFLPDLRAVTARGQTLGHGRRVQANVAGQANQLIFRERAAVSKLVLEDQIVIGPELALFGRAFAGFGRAAGFRAQDGEMFVDKTNFTGIDVLFTKPAQRVGGKPSAVRSLEVAKLDDGDRRILIALKMTSIR